MDNFENIKNGLIVSCQALPDEPLHSSFIMGRMAVAAKEGGAVGIRANTKKDILEIKEKVNLPVIGIVKKDYPNNDVYITPTMNEVRELVEAKVDIIAVDATSSTRPGEIALKDFIQSIKKEYPDQKLMADCSTISEAIYADELGFDFIGTTLVGYTSQSKELKIETNDFEIIKEILKKVNKPVIAEGNINTPEKAKRVLELGCYSVVVGSMITRPQVITKKFTDYVKNKKI